MKKAIFLTGSMGSGKSTILKQSKVVGADKILTYCQDFDILGTIVGADSLSKYKKEYVFSLLPDYAGSKIIIAGEFYSKQIDVQRFEELGFTVYCLFLNVPRDVIYKRVIIRGGGRWNELTYKHNINQRVAFFKKFQGQKVILKNEEPEDILKNYNYIKSI